MMLEIFLKSMIVFGESRDVACNVISQISDFLLRWQKFDKCNNSIHLISFNLVIDSCL